jgi:hypothetical protein
MTRTMKKVVVGSKRMAASRPAAGPPAIARTKCVR